jgi:hypothetical protein
VWALRGYIAAALMVLALSVSTVAIAQWIKFANNNVGPNGYLLDNSSGFLIDDVDPASGKIFAR